MLNLIMSSLILLIALKQNKEKVGHIDTIFTTIMVIILMVDILIGDYIGITSSIIFISGCQLPNIKKFILK